MNAVSQKSSIFPGSVALPQYLSVLEFVALNNLSGSEQPCGFKNISKELALSLKRFPG